MNKLKSAGDEAREVFRNRIQIPKLYLEAFLFTQKLEFLLRWILIKFIMRIQDRLKDARISYKPKVDNNWNARQFLNRIRSYLPKNENGNFYTKVNKAIDKRNDFIHNCFKVKSEKGVGINLDIDAFHLSNDSLEKLQSWLNAYSEAEPVILTVIHKIKYSVK